MTRLRTQVALLSPVPASARIMSPTALAGLMWDDARAYLTELASKRPIDERAYGNAERRAEYWRSEYLRLVAQDTEDSIDAIEGRMG